MALAMHEVKRTRSVVLLSAIRSLCGVLVAASCLAGSLGAQEASPESDGPPPATIQDIVVLLDVGVDSRTIMTFLDRRGWPGDLSLSALTTIFRFDVSTAFRSALLQRAGAVPEIAALPLRFKVLDLCAEHGLTLIHPRTVTPSVTLADPLCLEMEERPGASWFDGRREGVHPAEDSFIRGYHCYMAPSTAAALHRKLMHMPRENPDLPRSDYSDLSTAEIFK